MFFFLSLVGSQVFVFLPVAHMTKKKEPFKKRAHYSLSQRTKMNCSSPVSTAVQWYTIMQCARINFYLIPAALLTTSTLLLDSLLLFCILRNSSLRQETRYLLLGNTFLADALFLLINLVKVSSNALDIEIPYICCQAIIFTTVTTFCSSVQTVTLMVIDTFAAVRWPLHYNKILPRSRIVKIIGFVWAFNALVSMVLLLVTELSNDSRPESLKVCVVLIALACVKQLQFVLQVYYNGWVVVCSVLVVYCYIRLYNVTKSSGIWSSRYSRARQTLLVHSLMLVMYFAPCLVFTVQLAKFERLNKDVNVWLNTMNLTVLMLLPRACSPYLYGLRNRKIYDTVKLMLCRKCLKSNDTHSVQAHAS
uniref:G-protein coupled receptors family 1 profile domain-containing protein n=1 Tax=Astyanax mexicanus TaxID=7994 RepID=A0A8B9HD08_ASTMX